MSARTVQSIPTSTAARPNTPVKGLAAIATAAPVDGAALVEDCVALPAAREAEADELAEADLALLAALTLALALELAALPLAVGVATARHISPAFNTSNRSLTTTNVPHDSKRVLAQTRRPAPQVALPTRRTRRSHQHGCVAKALIAAQASRLREQRSSRAGRPEHAVRPGAALREGAGGRECCWVVAGACVGNYVVTSLVCY